MLLDLFSLQGNSKEDRAVQASLSLDNRPVVQGPAAKPGRKSYHVSFPSIADRAIEYLQQHGWSAQERRRNCIATSIGVSLESLRNHLLATVPGLKAKEIS